MHRRTDSRHRSRRIACVASLLAALAAAASAQATIVATPASTPATTPATPASAPATTLATPASTPATTLGQGAWSYFGDARAVYAQGAIFTAWCTPAGRIQLARIARDGSVKVITLMSNLGHPDDHNNPSLLVRPDGRIAAFWSPHSGRIFPVSAGTPSALYYRTSLEPGGMRFGPRCRATPRASSASPTRTRSPSKGGCSCSGAAAGGCPRSASPARAGTGASRACW